MFKYNQIIQKILVSPRDQAALKTKIKNEKKLRKIFIKMQKINKKNLKNHS